MIAHALEVDDDREQRDHDPQVAGQRRLLREQQQRLVVDRIACAIDLVVVADDAVGERDVAFDQGLERALDLAIDHRAHLQDAVLEAGEVGVELLARHTTG